MKKLLIVLKKELVDSGIQNRLIKRIIRDYEEKEFTFHTLDRDKSIKKAIGEFDGILCTLSCVNGTTRRDWYDKFKEKDFVIFIYHQGTDELELETWGPIYHPITSKSRKR